MDEKEYQQIRATQQTPGNPRKTAENEFPLVLKWLRSCPFNAPITATVVSHKFDLVMAEAETAIERLIAEGFLVRNADWGGTPMRNEHPQ